MTRDINTLFTITQGFNFVEVAPDNLHQALELHSQIWPDNHAESDYAEKLQEPINDANITWLVYHHDVLIGLIGIFTFDPNEPGYDDGESVWGDWLAILPQFRGNGYSKQILHAVIAYLKGLGQFKYFRFDTRDYHDRVATKLYDKIMHLREKYTAESMPDGCHELVYTYSLNGSKIKPWNNRFLDLQSYDAIEKVVI